VLQYLELFFGKSYTGKTARMLHEIRAEPRVVLVDPKCAQLVTLKGYDHVWPEFVPGKRGGWTGEQNPVNYFRGCEAGKFRVIIHIREHLPEQLNSLCLLLRAVRTLTLAVDELGLFIPSGSAGALPPAIMSAMISGSHEALKFCGTAQIPSLVHFIARSNASRIRWFRTTEKNSIAAAESYMPPEFVTSLPYLPDYVCVETSDAAPAFRDESMVGKIKILSARALPSPAIEK
jgi:hypothetical protein